MADVNETLVKEAIRRAEEEAKEKTRDLEAEETPEDTGNSAEEAESAQKSADTEGTEAAGQESTDDAESGSSAAEEVSEEKAHTDTEKELKKASVFGKKSKKDKKDDKIEELTAKVEELNDRHLRDLAEFENFRKRTEREKSQMFEIGAKSVIEKILPSLDSFERGLASISEEDRANPIAEGMDKIYKQLMSALTDAGVTVIETVGKEFDPELHNAVMHEENEEFGENTVSEELQKGYMYHDSVVRHSMVKVAN